MSNQGWENLCFLGAKENVFGNIAKIEGWYVLKCCM